MENLALRFVRWGAGLTVLGLVTGYLPLAHYLMKDALPSCPTAPVHGHTILLSFVGMTMFGLVYRTLPAWGGDAMPLGLVRTHFWCAVIGTLGVCANGTLGYELLSHLGQPGFYYNGDAGLGVRNLWFSIDGVFLTIYGAGCILFLYILMTYTKYAPATHAAGRSREAAA